MSLHLSFRHFQILHNYSRESYLTFNQNYRAGLHTYFFCMSEIKGFHVSAEIIEEQWHIILSVRAQRGRWLPRGQMWGVVGIPPGQTGPIPPLDPESRAGLGATRGRPSPGQWAPPWGWDEAGLGHQPVGGGQAW